MSMSTVHYLGWYILCSDVKHDEPDADDVFPKEDWINVAQMAGSDNFNGQEVFVFNSRADWCHHLDEESEQGIINIRPEALKMNDEVRSAGILLSEFYKKVQCNYGLVTYCC